MAPTRYALRDLGHRCTGVPLAQLFDFRDPLPMPAGAAGLVAAVSDAAPRVGLLLELASGRPLPVSCPAVRRVALVEVARGMGLDDRSGLGAAVLRPP